LPDEFGLSTREHLDAATHLRDARADKREREFREGERTTAKPVPPVISGLLMFLAYADMPGGGDWPTPGNEDESEIL